MDNPKNWRSHFLSWAYVIVFILTPALSLVCMDLIWENTLYWHRRGDNFKDEQIKSASLIKNVVKWWSEVISLPVMRLQFVSSLGVLSFVICYAFISIIHLFLHGLFFKNFHSYIIFLGLVGVWSIKQTL